MSLNRNKLYILLSVACGAGYIWLLISNFNSGIRNNEFGVCIFKHVTNIPCPSCGSTRSLISLLHGNIIDSLYWNPIGIILATVMVTAPLWILIDLLTKRDSLFRFYTRTEMILKQKRFAIPAILLVMANWIWNIHKGL